MTEQWTDASVEDVCELIVDCVNKTAPKVNIQTPYKMIRTTNVRNGRVDLTDCKFVESDIFDKWTRRAKVLEGDVILTREAPVGEVGMIRSSDTVFLGQRLMQYRANPKKMDNRFLLYSFLSPALKQQFDMHEGSGSVVSHIRVPDCHKFKLKLPPLPEQKAIAHILGTLDDKIELNRQTNKTLEAMARAIFKSWFVDFDPVHANHAKKRGDPGDTRKAALPLSPDTLDLFPDSFQDSELGEIPVGWEVLKLAEVINISHGFAFKGEHFSESTTSNILLTPGNFKIGGGFKIDKLKYYNGPIDSDYELQAKDLVVTMTDLSKASDTLGYPALVPHSDTQTFLHNQRIGRVSFKPECSFGKTYLYQFMCTDQYRYEVLATASGSTVSHTSPTKILACEVVSPTKKIAEKYEFICMALHDKQTRNSNEISSLTTLRDTLLPKLISGDLRIKDAEKFLKDAPL